MLKRPSATAGTGPVASHFDTGATLPKIAWGRGSWLHDTEGRTYLDGSGGPAVFCLGHGHREINQALHRQLDRIAHVYHYDFTSDPLEELTALLRAQAGEAAHAMVFVSGGSEAVESALKLALQYQNAIGEPKRRRFIARRRSWHGNTLGALAVSEFLERRRMFEGALIPVSHLGPVNAYRPPEGIAPDDLARHCAAELEAEILRLGPGNVAGFIFEPVVGAAGGVVPAPPHYAQLVREVCDRRGVVMIADEVMCGAGRCGTWRALEHDRVIPDITAVAKGLAGGYVPLGAALYTSRIAEPIRARHGAPLTGHTFSGHTLACAAGVAVQRIIFRDRLVERVRRDGATLLDMLRSRLGDIACVGDIRGRGFLIGIEFVSDRRTKAPFDPALRFHLRLKAQAKAEGLICYPCGGNFDGVAGDTVILAPPYNISEEDISELAIRLERAIRATEAACGTHAGP